MNCGRTPGEPLPDCVEKKGQLCRDFWWTWDYLRSSGHVTSIPLKSWRQNEKWLRRKIGEGWGPRIPVRVGKSAVGNGSWRQ